MALRALQLKAYAAAIDALRVSDPLSPNALQLVESLKKTFKISDPRHCAEVRRACSDRQLREVEKQVRGHDTSTAWLRRVRRTVPSSTEPFGMATIAQRKLADNIIKSLEKNRAKPKPMHLVVKQEELAQNDTPVESDPSEVIFIRSNFEPLENDETRIKLPGGTVIRIGESKPDPSKPGRKRKGEIVVKEVVEQPKRKRTEKSLELKKSRLYLGINPRRSRKVKKAIHRLRKQLNTDRTLPLVAEEKSELVKVEPASSSAPTVKSEPQPATASAIIIQNGRRLSHKSEPASDQPIPSVIIKSAPLVQAIPSSRGTATSVIQSTNSAQSCTIVTLPVTQPLRRSNPSTPFMMNDILGGGGLPIAPKGAAVILPNTSPRPVGGIIKTLPEIAPSRATPETLLAKRTPTRIEQSPVSVTSRPSSVHRTSIQSKPSPHLELPISYSRQQVTPPSGRLTADHHLRQHSPIPTPRQPPMRIVPMSHSTQFPQAFSLHQSGAILAPHELRRASVLHSSLDQSSQLLRPQMHQLRMSQPMMNQTLQPLLHSSNLAYPNLKLQNGTNYYTIDRKLNSNNR